VDTACAGRLKALLERGDFAGRAGDTLLIADLPGIKASRVLLTGLGAKKSYHRRSWRKAWAAARRRWRATRIASCALAIDRPEAKQLDDYYFGRASRNSPRCAVPRQRSENRQESPRARPGQGAGRSGAQAAAAERGLAAWRGGGGRRPDPA